MFSGERLSLRNYGIVASIIKTLAPYINYDIATHSIQLSGYQVESYNSLEHVPVSPIAGHFCGAEIYAQASN